MNNKDTIRSFYSMKNSLSRNPKFSFPSNNKFNLNKLCLAAVLSALYICLGFFSIPLGNLKITVEGFPIILAGFILGPSYGIMVGFTGPFLYQIMNYGITPTTLLWILPHMITGLFCGAFSIFNESLEIIVDGHCSEKEHNKAILDLVCFLIVICWLSTFFNSVAIYFDSKMFGYYQEGMIKATIAIKLIIGFIKGIIYSVAFTSIFKKLLRFVNKK